MIRIIAGSAKGRRLKIPKGQVVRPTSDKVRGAIFNILAERIIGADVLDLYSGSGALGVEALSRGAGNAVFVDSNTRYVTENLRICGFSARVITGDVRRVIKKLDKNFFDIIFADPPYGRDLARNLLSQLDNCSILKNFSLAVVEHSKRDAIDEPLPWKKVREKRYGDTVVSMYEKHNRNLPGDV